MQKFISVDWGTSALRIRIIDSAKALPLAEVSNNTGISAVFNLWKQSGKPKRERLSFYQAILLTEIKALEEKLDFSISDLPLVISGMASSSIGMINLPYKEIPFSMDGHDLNVKMIEGTKERKNEMLIISGARTDDDVMRGEETQLIGSVINVDKEDHLFIFPGTHSKHILVRDGKTIDFKTYMTGELFELLSKKSILSNDVETTYDLLNPGNLESFEKGVAESMHTNILNSAFRVRINNVFEKLSKQQNYCYLSGLLIGTELKELTVKKIRCTLVADELQKKFYSAAMQKLNINHVKYLDAAKALIDGHCKVFGLYKEELGLNEEI